MQRLMFGALGGLSATMAMTVAMRLAWQQLELRERYPLPPREIVARVFPRFGERQARLCAVLAHFGFGALAGAVYGMLPRRWPLAVPYGVFVWTASYLGWIPALNILSPATRHPSNRNLLMIAVHVVWGATLGACLRELETASARIFADGPKRDAATDEVS